MPRPAGRWQCHHLRSYDCRSSQGYEFSGDTTVDRWEGSGWNWERYDFDIEVIGDTEDVSFDRIRLRGAVVYVDGQDDSTLDEAVQVNVEATAEGWLSRADLDDPREPLWQPWAVTARYETTKDGLTRVDGNAVLGTLGGFGFTADGLREGCPAVPDGTVRLSGTQDAALVPGTPTAARPHTRWTVPARAKRAAWASEPGGPPETIADGLHGQHLSLPDGRRLRPLAGA